MKLPSLSATLYHLNLLLFCLIVILLAGSAFGEDSSKMPLAAQTLIDREQAQEKVLQDKLATDIAKLHKDLANRLKPQVDAATRQSDLEGAMAIKAEIASLKGPEVLIPPDIKDVLTGTLNFTLPNGHCGPLLIQRLSATDVPSGITGNITIADNVATIAWGNNTSWTVTVDGAGVLTVHVQTQSATMTAVTK
jgi:hypothetical protein